MKKICFLLLWLFLLFVNRTVLAVDELTIATYNIMFLGQTNTRLNKIADFIVRNKIDIIGFQESNGFEAEDCSWSVGCEDRNATKYIQEQLARLGWEMPYRSTIANNSTQTLSKYPIDNSSIVDPIILRAVIATISVGDKKIRLINNHPPHSQGCVHVDNLHNRVSGFSSDYANFWLGDFNVDRSFECYTSILNDFVDACDPLQDNSCGDTVNEATWGDLSGSATYAADYIFIRKDAGWSVVSSFSDHQANTSDHFPVVAKLKYGVISSSTPLPTKTPKPSPTKTPTPSSTPLPTKTPKPSPTSLPPPTITPIPPPCLSCSANTNYPKFVGNANCDNTVNLVDYAIWYLEMHLNVNKGTLRNDWMADFNCDGYVLENDIKNWAQTCYKPGMPCALN